MKRYQMISPDGAQEVELLEGFEEEKARLEARGWKEVERASPAEFADHEPTIASDTATIAPEIANMVWEGGGMLSEAPTPKGKRGK